MSSADRSLEQESYSPMKVHEEDGTFFDVTNIEELNRKSLALI